MIAGEYKGGDIPKGMEVYEIPALEWLNCEKTNLTKLDLLSMFLSGICIFLYSFHIIS